MQNNIVKVYNQLRQEAGYQNVLVAAQHFGASVAHLIAGIVLFTIGVIKVAVGIVKTILRAIGYAAKGTLWAVEHTVKL